jgi:hypothetical protein
MVSNGTDPWTSHRFVGLGVGKLEPKYCRFHSKKIQWNSSGRLGVRCWHWTELGCLQKPSSNRWTSHRFMGSRVQELVLEYYRFHWKVIKLKLGGQLGIRCWHWIEQRYLQKPSSGSPYLRCVVVPVSGLHENFG